MIQAANRLIAGQVPPCHIWLDWIEQTDVVEAHTIDGWIIRMCRDEHGDVVVNDGAIVTEKLTGVVTAALMESLI